MKKSKSSSYKITSVFSFLTIMLFLVSSPPAIAQSIEAGTKVSQTNPPNEVKAITGFSANINSLKFCDNCRYTSYSGNKLYVELRRLYPLNSNFKWGFRGFTNIFINGFFNKVGFGGTGIGPVIRYSFLPHRRWQAYTQADIIAGNDLNIDGGLSFYYGLNAGTTYKITDKVGLFLEAGPVWGYKPFDPSFNLRDFDVHVQAGIQLYRFN